MASLNPQQLQVARQIYGLAVGRGLSPEQAREVVAASYAESGLNPRATNRSSGAAGLFQLLSPGYRQRAQASGGLYNPVANTNAILPDYAHFFAQHPNAAPGEAGAAVERSGQGAGFYSSPMSLLGGLGQTGVNGSAPNGRTPQGVSSAQQAAPPTQGPSAGMTEALLASLRSTGAGAPLNLAAFAQQAAATRSQASTEDDQGTAAVASNAGQRSHSSKTPLASFKVIGLPFQGSHAQAFNQRGGSDNWQSENAVDLATPVGSPVYAVASGVIGPNIGSQGRGGRFAGQRLQIDNPENSFWYGHLSRLVVGAGQRVRAGQLIGYSGSANGVAHLHLAVRHGDPRRYIG